MKQLTEGMMEIMLRIEQNILDRGDPPKTYGCEVCEDKGCIVEMRKTRFGYEAAFAKPCPHCKYGEHWATMQRQSVDDMEKAGRTPNRKLRWIDAE